MRAIGLPPFSNKRVLRRASRRVSSWCSRLDGKSPVIVFLQARNSDVKWVTGPGKEEDEEGRVGGEERGGIGKISKQISDWARHNSDFHVCLPSDPSGLVSFGVMFKLLNYAREDSRVHTSGVGWRKGGPDYSKGFSLFRGSSFSPPVLALPWPREFPFSRYLPVDVAQLLTGRLLTLNLTPTRFQLLPLFPASSPRNYRFDVLTIFASYSVSIGYIIMQRYFSISWDSKLILYKTATSPFFLTFYDFTHTVLIITYNAEQES